MLNDVLLAPSRRGDPQHGRARPLRDRRLDVAVVFDFTKYMHQIVVLDSGCCGMAGTFGFEASHYDFSMDIGERRQPRGGRCTAEALAFGVSGLRFDDRRVRLGPFAEDAWLGRRRRIGVPREAAAAALIGAGIAMAALSMRALACRRSNLSSNAADARL